VISLHLSLNAAKLDLAKFCQMVCKMSGSQTFWMQVWMDMQPTRKQCIQHTNKQPNFTK